MGHALGGYGQCPPKGQSSSRSKQSLDAQVLSQDLGVEEGTRHEVPGSRQDTVELVPLILRDIQNLRLEPSIVAFLVKCVMFAVTQHAHLFVDICESSHALF